MERVEFKSSPEEIKREPAHSGGEEKTNGTRCLRKTCSNSAFARGALGIARINNIRRTTEKNEEVKAEWIRKEKTPSD